MMPIALFAVHLILAVLLFFFMNWIGRHSVLSDSYYQLTYFSRHDEAPAFNVVFRVLTPVVFLVVVAACLHLAQQSQYVDRLYMVVVYQQLLRWAYLGVMARTGLLRWRVQFTIAAATFALAWLAHREILNSPARLLPDLDNVSGELWVIVALFLYKLTDRIYAPADANAKKKGEYLSSRYSELKRRFGPIVAGESTGEEVEALVYAVMIYETLTGLSWFKDWSACSESGEDAAPTVPCKYNQRCRSLTRRRCGWVRSV